MVSHKRVHAWLAAIALSAVAAGCGDGDSGGLTMSEAKSRLVEDCTADGDTAQLKKACACIADEFEQQKLTPKRIDALRKIVADTDADASEDIPKEFDKAVSACAEQLARERR
jgi:hypothetical protein